jgi:hypothetical protein
MGIHFGFIGIQAPCEPHLQAAMKALFPKAEPTRLPSDPYDLLKLDIGVAVAVCSHDRFAIVQHLLTSTLLDRPRHYAPTAQEEWLAAQSRNAEVVVAYTHANTGACGHQLYHHGKCLRHQFMSEWDSHEEGMETQVPATYRDCPTSFENDYALQYLRAFMGISILKEWGNIADKRAYALQ